MPSRPHDATLRYEYPSAERARVVARSVSQEVDEIDGDRSATTVSHDGVAVVVEVVADDLVALRAGLNTWQSLISVAEQVCDAV